MSEFEKCPFCGSKFVIGHIEILNGDQVYFIDCRGCGGLFTFDNEKDETIADVIRRYNRRAKI